MYTLETKSTLTKRNNKPKYICQAKDGQILTNHSSNITNEIKEYYI